MSLLVAAAVVAGFLSFSVPGRTSPPPAPAQVRVAAEKTSAVASWERRTAKSSFRVEYSRDLDFSNAQAERSSAPTLALESLTPGTTYYLRVIAVSDEGKASTPSRSIRFTTDLPESAPKLKLGSSSSSTVRARWSSDAKDARFETQLATDPAFADPTSVVVRKKAVLFKKLELKTTYFVRVRVINPAGDALSPWSEVASRSPAPIAPLRVASFNIRKSTQANWPARRLAVAETIRSQDLDVAGLQEATPITVRGGVRQYADVVRLLGSSWALTDAAPNATGEARTIYNRERLELIDHGHIAVAGSTRFGVMRYVTWAIFEQKNTGKQFVFVNTHFVYQKNGAAYSHRTSAARQLVNLVGSVNTKKLPVVIVGDFNSGAYRNGGNGVYRTITGAGYRDPLVKSDALGSAEKRIHAELKTVNGYSRRPPVNAWTPMVDGIFVSPMRVAEWETVAKLDSSGRVIGTIPSDHNMIRVTVFLP